jgi:hypothetical protein
MDLILANYIRLTVENGEIVLPYWPMVLVASVEGLL